MELSSVRGALLLVCFLVLWSQNYEAIALQEGKHAGKANQPTVAIFGGGIAGLSAALELAERGFRVDIYERQPVFGGKARSIPVPNSGQNGRPNLPGEHGFRFFPGFYRHLPDTMSRIPLEASRPLREGETAQCVFDNLVNATKDMLARSTGPPWIFPTILPHNATGWFQDFAEVLHFEELDIPTEESLYFVERCYVMASSCEKRWNHQYDQITYWDFMHAANMSVEYQKYLVIGLTRDIVAAKAEVSSLKTLGRMFLRLVESALHNDLDRLLNGPTNEAMIFPWVNYLQSLGTKFHANSLAVGINLDQANQAIHSVTVQNISGGDQGSTFDVKADYYLFAVPAERIVPLVSKEIQQAAPSLSQVNKLKTDWMNGIQFYLTEDTPIVNGHIGYFDSKWALTSISQQQFWSNIKFSNMGDGQVKNCISVDISNWFVGGEPNGPSKGLAAVNCSKEQFKDEVWYQLHLHLPDVFPLDQSNLHSWFMDPDIAWTNGNDAPVTANAEPLLVNLMGTWAYRPEATTEIPNLFLASDYIRTETDVACMEAANEAARRAVNGILRQENRTDFAQIFELYWVEEFEEEREADCLLYEEGWMPLGWDFPVPSADSSSVSSPSFKSHPAEPKFNNFLMRRLKAEVLR